MPLRLSLFIFLLMPTGYFLGSGEDMKNYMIVVPMEKPCMKSIIAISDAEYLSMNMDSSITSFPAKSMMVL